jgi:hypothetical protein
MAATNVRSTEARPSLPGDGAFAAGLRNIRGAIESRLTALGVKDLRLGDTASQCVRDVPGMVIVDVAADGKSARVTFTRVEVEDCARCVDVHCVLRKIEDMVVKVRHRERRARSRTGGSSRRIQ